MRQKTVHKRGHGRKSAKPRNKKLTIRVCDTFLKLLELNAYNDESQADVLYRALEKLSVISHGIQYTEKDITRLEIDTMYNHSHTGRVRYMRQRDSDF